MKRIKLLIIATLLALLSLPATAAVEMFMKIDGIKGESQAPGHAGDIDVLAWHWGVSQSGELNRGRKATAAGKVKTGSITFTKYSDQASPSILNSCTEGKQHKSAILTVDKSDGSIPEYVLIRFTDLIVTGVVTNGPTADEDRLTEDVTLNFSEVKSDYLLQARDGSPGGKVETTWKIEKGE